MKVADYFRVPIDTRLSRSLDAKSNVKADKKFNLQEALKDILDNYNDARFETFKKHKVGSHVRNVVKQLIVEEVQLDENQLFTVGSVGKEKWAEIPWISIFIKDITTTATKGYYIVFLFRADMNGIYIPLNQGWTYFKEKYGTKLGHENIKSIARIIREKLNTAPSHVSLTEIELGGRGDLAQGTNRETF